MNCSETRFDGLQHYDAVKILLRYGGENGTATHHVFPLVSQQLFE